MHATRPAVFAAELEIHAFCATGVLTVGTRTNAALARTPGGAGIAARAAMVHADSDVNALGSAQFKIPGTNTCTGITLSPGGACLVTPTTMGFGRLQVHAKLATLRFP